MVTFPEDQMAKVTMVTFPNHPMAKVTMVTFPEGQMAKVTMVTFPDDQMAKVTMVTFLNHHWSYPFTTLKPPGRPSRGDGPASPSALNSLPGGYPTLSRYAATPFVYFAIIRGKVLQLQPRIQRIAQPVADVVERQRAQHNRDARQQRQPRPVEHKLLRRRQHVPPRWNGVLNAEPQERQ